MSPRQPRRAPLPQDQPRQHARVPRRVVVHEEHIRARMAKDALGLYLFYEDAQDVYEARNRQVKGEREKMQLKRLKNPRRYRCVVLRLIQGRCCLGVGLTHTLYFLPLTRNYLKRSGKCDFDKKHSRIAVKNAKKLT